MNGGAVGVGDVDELLQAVSARRAAKSTQLKRIFWSPQIETSVLNFIIVRPLVCLKCPA